MNCFRAFVAVLPALALASCASGDASSVPIDARDGNVPFALAGAGMPNPTPGSSLPGARNFEMTETIRFIFTNVTHRPQTIERLSVRQRSAGNTSTRMESTGVRVAKMIEPGEDIEIDVLVRFTRGTTRPGAIGSGIDIDGILELADGFRYLYPINIPVRVEIPARIP
ncbi:MAG TPA: hypothetical protein VMS56_13880 [Thermoanaerobaculia bacterium]|nr:hypothetical protein [Thermoanaerobaculia bacterium]